MNLYLHALKQYAVFNGRATRAELWTFLIVNVFIKIILAVISVKMGLYITDNPEEDRTLLDGLFAIAVFLPTVAVSVRRIHDVGLSGWWGWIFMPLMIPMIIVSFMNSKEDDDKQTRSPNDSESLNKSYQNKSHIVSDHAPWNPVLLIIFPGLWVLVQTQMYGTRLAEAIGGAIAILLLPLIISTIVFAVKKIKDMPYYNFTKHTFIGTIIVLILAIGGFVNSQEGWEPPSPAGLAHRQGDFEKSAMLRREACYSGDMENCEILGNLYRDGRGVEQNKIMAEILYEKACNGGAYDACYLLGLRYTVGDDGVDQDDSMAAKFHRKACDGENMNGCLELAKMYKDGLGVYQSNLMEEEFSQKAKKLLEKACDDGDEKGCYGLGDIFNEGVGVQQDYFKAKKFYEKACSGGQMASCIMLGNLYKAGNGTRKNYLKAKKFYGKACDAEIAWGCELYAELK